MMDPIASPKIDSVETTVVFRLVGFRSPKSDQLVPLAFILQVAKASVVNDQKRPLMMNPTEEK